ncbi:MAG TPA: TIGR00730 family Rossman fold protein [Candidatus Dependentiae bacterium]|nr:TIGR00730 family Rossman fold protein [Candidatus Dependentiae bacterium]HRQ62760.1 TIGR00730 family Rossman fold protein [Candidatus Dependentiae bacterium]
MKWFWLIEWACIPFKGRWYNPMDWWQILKATYYVSRLKDPIVTIFGGVGAYEEGKYTQWAYSIAQKCVENDMSVITGGGPGIMAAANCGAYDKAKELGISRLVSLGIGVYDVDPNYKNLCAPVVLLPYFFMRKWFLNNYASGFIVMPGGIGTAEELFEILNCMKTGKMKSAPIVLVGKNYWHHLIGWYNHAVEYELIKKQFIDLFIVTDDIDEAINLLIKYCR